MAYIQTSDQSEASMAEATGFPTPGGEGWGGKGMVVGGGWGGGDTGGTIGGRNNPFN